MIIAKIEEAGGKFGLKGWFQIAFSLLCVEDWQLSPNVSSFGIISL